MKLAPGRSVAAIAAAVIAGLGLAACGGSGGSSTSTGTQSSAADAAKAQFVSLANAICSNGQKAVSQALSAIPKDTHQQAAADVRSKFVPAIQSQIADLRALKPPPGDAQAVGHMLDLAQADLDGIKKDPSTILRASSNTDSFADFAEVAHPYGLTACDSAG